MSEDAKQLEEFRDKAAIFKNALDETMDKIRENPPRVALIEAVGLGVLLPLLGIKLLEVQTWFRAGHNMRTIDRFGLHSVAADLRRIADALELAADRAEKELPK